MITIIHGDDTAASRNYFLTQKNSFPAATIFYGDDVTLTDITQLLDGGGFFMDDTIAFFAEQVLTKKKSATELEAIITYVNSKQDSPIFLWEGKELDKKILAQFPKATVKLFKLPQMLFTFLDSLRPNNAQSTLQLFHQTIEHTDVEMVLPMLIRQFRLLLALHGQPAQIDETKRMAPWQQNKLQKQSKLFTQEHIIALYKKLNEIDIAHKTGGLSLPLSSTIDIFILEV